VIVRRLTLSTLRAAAPQGNKGVVPTDASYKKVQLRQVELLVNTALFLVHQCYYCRTLSFGCSSLNPPLLCLSVLTLAAYYLGITDGQ